jgi:hypothetical protein
MSDLVQLAVAGDVTEAEEIQSILASAGIDSVVETAVDHHPQATENAPQKVLVAAGELTAAQDAIEALTDPDELIADP